MNILSFRSLGHMLSIHFVDFYFAIVELNCVAWNENSFCALSRSVSPLKKYFMSNWRKLFEYSLMFFGDMRVMNILQTNFFFVLSNQWKIFSTSFETWTDANLSVKLTENQLTDELLPLCLNDFDVWKNNGLSNIFEINCLKSGHCLIYFTDDVLPRNESQSSTANTFSQNEVNESFSHSWLNNFESHCNNCVFSALQIKRTAETIDWKQRWESRVRLHSKVFLRQNDPIWSDVERLPIFSSLIETFDRLDARNTVSGTAENILYFMMEEIVRSYRAMRCVWYLIDTWSQTRIDFGIV